MRIIKGFALIFLMTTCIRDVDPNTILTQQKELVVYSFIEPGMEFISASVILSDNYYNQKRGAILTPNFISTAVVTIDNGSKYAKLTYNPVNKLYEASTTTFLIEQGKTYNLTVKYQSIVAKASCTVPMNIDYFPSYNLENTIVNGYKSYLYEISGKCNLNSVPLEYISIQLEDCITYTVQKDSISYGHECVTYAKELESNNILKFTYLSQNGVLLPNDSYNFIQVEKNFYNNAKYNHNVTNYDPLGEPSSTYSNFENAYGVFGASIKTKIVFKQN